MFRIVTLASLLAAVLVSCSSRPVAVPRAKAPTAAAEITFDDSRIADSCIVFAHLLVEIPDRYDGLRLKDEIESFAREHGADMVLFGMARESDGSPDQLIFRAYGPETPYSYKQDWVGWKYGFSDWNRGGPLTNFGLDRISQSGAAFELPVTAQAILLSCKAVP